MTNRNDDAGKEILAAVKEILEKHNVSGTAERKAPAYAHQLLDSMISSKNEPENKGEVNILRGAPGWAHALLDFLWDLF